MEKIIDYGGWKIVVARNYGNTTINAYTTAKPVKHITADTVDDVKKLIDVHARLEYLRQEILAERISYDEIAELEQLADYIDNDDTLLLEWANVEEGSR